MRRLIFSLIFLVAFSIPASSKSLNILVVRGIGGNIVAPMTTIIDGLRARGHHVVVAEFYFVPSGRYDVAIVHSAGDIPGLMSRAKKVITIDPTFIAPSCQPGSICTNYFAPIDRLPFFICCGGYSINGATNKQVPGTLSFFLIAPGHVSMPDRVAARVIAEAIK